jgi:hypothetical protein
MSADRRIHPINKCDDDNDDDDDNNDNNDTLMNMRWVIRMLIVYSALVGNKKKKVTESPISTLLRWFNVATIWAELFPVMLPTTYQKHINTRQTNR